MDAGIAFGRVLRRLRLKAGFTQEQLGFEADLMRNFVSLLELGQQQPSLSTILKLASAFDRPAHELVRMVEAELGKPGRKKA